jgi:hypothetical protein
LDAAGRYYQSHLSSAEDYELWLRLLFVTRFANLPDVLVQYRQWPGSLTRTQAEVQRANTTATFSKVAGKLLGKPVPGELHLHINALYLRDHLLSEAQAQHALTFQIELYQALLNADLFDAEHLHEVHISMAKGAANIARHSPHTMPLILQTAVTLARTHSPLWLRRLWARIKL